jgi:hypothetical protein
MSFYVHECQECSARYGFAIGDRRTLLTTRDSIMPITIIWTCPQCQQPNEKHILLGYTPLSPSLCQHPAAGQESL